MLYVAFTLCYLAASGNRLKRPTPYNHFAYLAHSWLEGRLALTLSPPNENDWAKVDVLTLRDGRTVKGMFSGRGNQDRFYPLSGPPLTIMPDEIVARTYIRYVSFPPFPAVLMLPWVAIAGVAANDVVFTVLWAGLNPALFFLLLGALRRRGYSERTPIEDLWLTVAFGLGSVYFYSSVIGQVWYTAHVVATTLVIGYVWSGLDARHPVLAGLCLGLGFATRAPLGFAFAWFIWESVRVNGGWRSFGQFLWRKRRFPPGWFATCLKAAIPALAIVALLLLHNELRFERASEFGHKFLNITWQDRIQRFGLFNYHFLSRNLATALTLLPRILVKPPYVQVSQHGMSLLVTSPFLILLLRPRRGSPLGPGLWLTVLGAAIPHLLYQNSGFVQFGYRFSLDYMVLLMVLIALGNRKLGFWFKAMVAFSIAVNLFGALTFDRSPSYSYTDTFFPHGLN
ncbi:MAG: hypothetical protein KA712_03840 [Myxococcales bacterium]|nr:hypothetical protein [Myxococcales bacterium]